MDGIMAPGLRPDFLVAGAQKAGTTTLHGWLSDLPEIDLPRDKETHYLTHPERFSLGACWYEAQFASAGARGRQRRTRPLLLGEVDPELLHHPRAALRAHALYGAPRVVIILRDPLERSRSQHRMSVARGIEDLDFEEALGAERGRVEGTTPESFASLHYAYLGRSAYARDVQRYLDVFGPERVLLVRFEELFEPRDECARLAAFQHILDFIGYAGAAHIESPTEVMNGAWAPRSRALARFLHRGGRLRRTLGRLVPSRALRRRLGQALDAWNRAGDPRSGAARRSSERLGAHWVEAFEREITAIEALTGWCCSSWHENVQSAARGGR